MTSFSSFGRKRSSSFSLGCVKTRIPFYYNANCFDDPDIRGELKLIDDFKSGLR